MKEGTWEKMYKGFHKDGYCEVAGKRVYYFEGVLHTSDARGLCQAGTMHCCRNLKEVFMYYDWANPDFVFREVYVRTDEKFFETTGYDAKVGVGNMVIGKLVSTADLDAATGNVSQKITKIKELYQQFGPLPVGGSLGLYFLGLIPYRPFKDLDIIVSKEWLDTNEIEGQNLEDYNGEEEQVGVSVGRGSDH